MTVCLLYSGWLRTYEQCKPNHNGNLQAEVFRESHINERNTEINYITEYVPEYDSNKAPETKAQHTINQWRNMWLCFEQAPKDCDIYCRMRYDIKLSGPVVFKDYEINDNTVWIPENGDFRDGCNDQFAFGNYNAMKNYFNVYLHYRDIFANGHQFHTESYLKRNLINNGIEIKRLNIQTEIIR